VSLISPRVSGEGNPDVSRVVMPFSSPRFLLRVGLAFTLLYAAAASFSRPTAWAAFFPAWTTAFVPREILLPAFAFFEVVLALWLVSNRFPAIAAASAAFVFGAIAIFNLAALDIIFRDVGLAFAGLALVSLSFADDTFAQTLLARYRNLPPRRRIALWFFLLGALMLSYALLGLRGIIAPPRLP